MNRLLALLTVVLMASAGCDSAGPDRPDAPSAPAGPVVQTKTIRAMHVFGVGAPDASNPLLVAEADTLRGAVVLNVWAEVETDRPCPTGRTCEVRWVNEPLASRTTLRLSVPIAVNGTAVAAGADLMPLLSLGERASLITPSEQRTLLFAVRLDPARFTIPPGQVTASMVWGADGGASLEDTTTFTFVPAAP